MARRKRSGWSLAFARCICRASHGRRVCCLCHHALKAVKRLFGIPDFHYTAIADGIRTILAGRQSPAFDFARAPMDDPVQADMIDLFGSWIA